MARGYLWVAALVVAVSGYDVVDYDAVRREVKAVIDVDQDLGPAMLRLGWHSAATWVIGGDPPGGACGAGMRWPPESEYYSNRGLEKARTALASIRILHPRISFSDLWVLAAYTAVEHMEGPKIEFTPGRPDAERETNKPPPEDRIPMWNMTEDIMTAHFSRMGLTTREMVALVGAHSVGHTRTASSGFPFFHWDTSPYVFDNMYYRLLLNQHWQYSEEGVCGSTECRFYYNRSWIMLLTDYHIRSSPALSSIAQEYADDMAAWHRDFAAAFKKLTEFGMPARRRCTGQRGNLTRSSPPAP